VGCGCKEETLPLRREAMGTMKFGNFVAVVIVGVFNNGCV